MNETPDLDPLDEVARLLAEIAELAAETQRKVAELREHDGRTER